MATKADPPRFIADEMLMRLGRWLRAAGYDVRIFPPGVNDARLVHAARAEHRLLITRDRKLLEFQGAASVVILLRGNRLEDCALELSRKTSINWLYRPFSRCLICNAPLIEGDQEAWREVPETSRRFIDKTWRCTGCGKVYWRGSHVARMRRRLAAWQRLSACHPR